MKKVKILNVQFDACTKDEALARIMDVLAPRESVLIKQQAPGRHIVTPNPEMLLAAQQNKKFETVLNHAWLSIPDGIGILWASTFQESARRNGPAVRFFKALLSLGSLLFYPSYCRKIFPERITGVDLMESICSLSRTHKTRIFLLGAKPGTAEKVREFLEARYQGVQIAGCFSGSPNEDDFPAIQAVMAETQPEILFVAYGAPAQELWIADHLAQLKSVKIAIGVGGAFDFLAGEKKRAPKWMQRLGIEWLYRLLQEPKRIKRIWNAAVRFPWKIILK